MKKTGFILAIVLLVSGAVWAQEAAEPAEEKAPKEIDSAVALDIAPLFRGLAATESDLDSSGFGFGVYYEKQLNDH